MSFWSAVGKFFLDVGKAVVSYAVNNPVSFTLQSATLIVGVKGFMQARQMQAKGQDILANKTSAGGKLPVIYGTRRVGAQVIYMDVSANDSRDLYVVYALSVGECDEILGRTIELDGNPLTDTARFRDGGYIGSDKISSGSGSLNTVSQNGTGIDAGAGQFGTNPAAKYRYVMNLHHGAATQTADPMLVASMPNWTNLHRLDGVCYIAAHYGYDKEGIWKGVPQLTVQVRGKKVFDPRDTNQTFGTVSTYEYSDNPALTFLDYITNNEYGKGLTQSQINMSTFTAAANVCDTQVDQPYFNGSTQSLTWSGNAGDDFITIGGADPNTNWWQNKVGEVVDINDANGNLIVDGKEIKDVQRNGFYDQNDEYIVYINDTLGSTYSSQTGSSLVKVKRFHCNGYLDANKNVMDNAKELLANMRGIFLYIDGKYELSIEDTGTTTFSINDNHIIADAGISVDYGNKDKKANKVIVEFFNANKKYELDTATVLHDATPEYYSDDGDEILEIKAEFPYISDPYIAYNMGKAILTRSRNQTTMQFLGTPEMYKLNVGDIVDLTYAGLGFSGKVCRVEALELQPNGLVAVSLIEYFDVYTWEVPPQEPVEELANLPSAYAVKAPTGLSFTDSSSSSTGRPILSWDAPTDYPDYEFRVNVVDDSGNQLMNRIVNTTFAELNFTPTGINYVASVTSLNTLGTESDAETETFSVSDEPVGLGDIRADAVTANTIDVNELSAITANLGAIDAGSIDIGSGAFSVTSAGVMTATGATISGGITATSLNVTNATVTGTLDASVITLNSEPLDSVLTYSESGGIGLLTLNEGAAIDGDFVVAGNFEATGTQPDLIVGKVTGISSDTVQADAILRSSTGSGGFRIQAGSGNTQVVGLVYDAIGGTTLSADGGASGTFKINADGALAVTFDSSQNATFTGEVIADALGLPSQTPSTTTNKLYNVGGSLYFNGSQLGTGSGDITAVTAGDNLNGGGTSGAVTLNLDSTISGDHTFSNNVVIGGNLDVQGTTTTIDTTNLDVKDKNITLNYGTGDTSANANGAGFTIQDAVSAGNDASLTWTTANDTFNLSHPLSITGALTASDLISTDSHVQSGDGSGGVALTINDGYGNANITWNHLSGVPEQNGNSARIEVNTDATSAATMYFELKSGVTSGVAVQTDTIMLIDDTGLEIASGKTIRGNGQLTLTANDMDFSVADTTDTVQNFIWRDHSASKLYLGTADAVATLRSALDLNSNNITNAGTINSGAITSTGDISGATIEGYTFPSFPSVSGYILKSDTSGNLQWTANAISSYVDSGDDRVVTSTGSTGIRGEANLTYNETDGLKITDSLPKLSLIPTSSSATQIILDSSVQGFINFKDGATTDASIGYEGVINNKLSISCGNGVTFGSSNLATNGTISSGAITSTGTSEFASLNLGGVTSTGSSFLSGTQRIVSDGYIATQAIYNYGETGTSPAAIVFGNGSTYGTDQISLITSGVIALYIDSSQNIAISGTVDGRDLATDGSKLDGISAGANVTPSWVPSTNPNYLTAITSSQVTTALGYTPYQEGTALSATSGVFSSTVNIDGELRLDARTDGGSGDNVLAFKDSGGDYSIRHNVNDGNGNYSISIGYSGTGVGEYAVTGDGVGKILMNGHNRDGAVSLNAAPTGTAGNNISFSIGLLVDGSDNTIRVGASANGAGMDSAAGTKVFDASANAFATSYSIGTQEVITNGRNLTNIGTISSGAITASGGSSGRYTGLEVVNTTNAGGTETAIGLGVVSAGTDACDVKLVANRVGANSGSDFYIEQTDSLGTQQETFRITESGNATFAGTISSGAITSSGVLTLSSVASDTLNFSGSTNSDLRGISFNGRAAVTADSTDGWLRFNNNSEFTNGMFSPGGAWINGFLRSSQFQISTTTVIDSSRNLVNIGTISSGAITSSGLTVDYTGNRTGDAGILVTNDASDWGIKVDKDGTADYGILSQTDGENAVVVRNAAGVNKIQLQGDGDATFAGTISSGAITSTGNSTFSGVIGVGGTSTNSNFGVYLQNNKWYATQYSPSHDVVRINANTTGGLDIYNQTDSGFANVRAGSYNIGSTTVIDGSRNLTGIASANIGGGTSYFSEKLLVSGKTRVAGQLDIALGSGYSNYGTLSHDDSNFIIGVNRVSGTGDINLAPYGNVNITNGGLEINGTTVIDSSRQLVNIAKILGNSSSGGVTTFNVGRGDVYFENNGNSNANGAGITLRTSTNPTANTDGSIFDVRSSGQAARLWVGQDLTSAGYNNFYVGRQVVGGEGTPANYEIELNASNGSITAQGNITAYGSVSDIRQKENIEQIDKPIERLEKIKGITFNYKKKKEDERLMGVIAQDLLQDDILKLAVYEQEDFKAEDDDPLKNTYGVRYEHLTAILIEAVKEQQKQIDELKQRLDNDS